MYISTHIYIYIFKKQKGDYKEISARKGAVNLQQDFLKLDLVENPAQLTEKLKLDNDLV